MFTQGKKPATAAASQDETFVVIEIAYYGTKTDMIVSTQASVAILERCRAFEGPFVLIVPEDKRAPGQQGFMFVNPATGGVTLTMQQPKEQVIINGQSVDIRSLPYGKFSPCNVPDVSGDIGHSFTGMTDQLGAIVERFDKMTKLLDNPMIAQLLATNKKE